jgi:P-type Ca2+ transporter type 2C
MQTIKSDDLTVGDRIGLSYGDTIPVDCLLIESEDFSVNEQMLTGDPNQVGKQSVGHYA